MNIENCRCGAAPVCEPGPLGYREWDICCLNCGTRSPVFHNRTEAVVHWNNLLRDHLSVSTFNDSVDDTASASGKKLLGQILKPFRRETSAVS